MELNRLSRSLTRHLRHEPSLPRDVNGFTHIKDLASIDGRFTAAIVLTIAEADTHRYLLDTSKTKIKALQGHSVATQLTGVPLPSNTFLVHGTNRKVVSKIMEQGLSRMARTHVHFCSGSTLEEAIAVVKAKEKSYCNAYIVMNVERCLASTIPFTLLPNNTVLCPGDANGFIPPELIETVLY